MDFISEKLLSMLLDLFVGEVLKEIRAELDPQIQEIHKRLNLIESRVDKVQLLHLQSGLSSMRDGQYDDALKEFIYAERADDFAAVSRFWLSMLLYERGRSAEAAEKFKEALRLNPFVIPLEFMQNRKVKELPLHSFSNVKLEKWSKRFDGEATILGTVPQEETWGRWFFRGAERFIASNGAQVLIRAVSTSGEHPIVQWDLAYGNVPEEFTLFTQLSLESGSAWWTRRYRDRRLLFGTPRYYVLESEDSPSRFVFISAARGKEVYQMSQTYFETAFFPDYPRRKKIPGYVASNHRMSYHDDEVLKGDPVYAMKSVKSLYDPFGMKAFRIDVYNYKGGGLLAGYTSSDHPVGKARVQRVE